MNIENINKLNEMENEFLNKYFFSEAQPKFIKDKELRLKQIAYFIANAKKITVITGAGLSTDSGIADFRSNNGVYSENPEEIFSIEHFEKKPEDLINLLIKIFNNNFEINFGHLFLKKLEEEKDVTIITQNIDTLHSQISTNVIEIHGSIRHSTCINCGNMYEMLWDKRNLDLNDFKCDCGDFLKPNIVLYGEDVKQLDKATENVMEADLVMVLGSSLVVEPVASLPLQAKLSTPIVIINKDATHLDNNNSTIVVNDSITKTLKEIDNILF